ncbi:MAG: hypothetical protein EON95_09000 [Caulobacteraceae bacterium]|nr:MAG: hypothetical protein EON95_09000 [Caulobacteraceae bacterium]
MGAIEDRRRAAAEATRDGGALARSILTDEAVARVMGHPEFPGAALAAMAAWAPQPGEANALAVKVRDLAQWMCAVWALQLHASPEGLTHASLTRWLAPLGVTTKTRAHRILIYLRFTGLIRPADSADGRSKAYQPTAQLLDLFRSRYRRDLEICARVLPAAEAALARWDSPAVMEATVAAHGRIFGSALEARTPGPSLDVISDRNGGMTILGQLMLQACADGVFPPTGPLAPNISEIARRAGVSRPQVHSVLRAGQKGGLFQPLEDGRLAFTPLLIEHLAGMLAAAFLGLAWASETACAADETAQASG